MLQQVSALGGGVGQGVDQAPANHGSIEQALDADGSDTFVSHDSGNVDQPLATHGTMDQPLATHGIMDQPLATHGIMDQPLTTGILLDPSTPATYGTMDLTTVDKPLATDGIIDQPPLLDGTRDQPPTTNVLVDQALISYDTLDQTLDCESKVVDLPENLDDILLLPSPPASPPPTTEAHRPTPTITTRAGNVRAKDWGINTSSLLDQFASSNSTNLTAGPHMLSSDERLHGSVVIRLNIEKGLNGNIPPGQTTPKLIKAAIKKIVEGFGGHEAAFGSAENPGVLRGLQVTNRCVDLTLEFSARGNAAMIHLLSQQSVTIEIDGKEHFIPLLPSISVRGLRGSTRVLIKHPSLSSISKRGITETLLKAAGYRVGLGDAYSVTVVGEHLGLAGRHDPFLPEGTPLSDTVVAWVIPPINDPHLLNIPFRFQWMDAAGNFLIKGDPTAPKKPKPLVAASPLPSQQIGPIGEAEEAELPSEPQLAASPLPLQQIGPSGEAEEVELPSEPQLAAPPLPLQQIGPTGATEEAELPSEPQVAAPPLPLQQIGPTGEAKEVELPCTVRPFYFLRSTKRLMGLGFPKRKEAVTAIPQAVPNQVMVETPKHAPPPLPLQAPPSIDEDITLALPLSSHPYPHASPSPMAVDVEAYVPPHARRLKAKPQSATPRGTPSLDPTPTAPLSLHIPTAPTHTAPLQTTSSPFPPPLPLSLDEFIELRSSTLESFISKGLDQTNRQSSLLASSRQHVSPLLSPRPMPPPPPPSPLPPKPSPPPRFPGTPIPFINPNGTSMVTIKNQQDERSRRQRARKWHEAISQALDKLVSTVGEAKMPTEEKTRISHAILSDDPLLLCLNTLSPPMNDSELPKYLLDKLSSFVSGRSFGKAKSIKQGQGCQIRHQIDDNKDENNKKAKICKVVSAKIRGCPGL